MVILQEKLFKIYLVCIFIACHKNILMIVNYYFSGINDTEKEKKIINKLAGKTSNIDFNEIFEKCKKSIKEEKNLVNERKMIIKLVYKIMIIFYMKNYLLIQFLK